MLPEERNAIPIFPDISVPISTKEPCPFDSTMTRISRGARGGGGGRAIRQALMTFRLAEVNRREHTVAEVENRVLERG